MRNSLHTVDEVTEAVDNLRQLNEYAYSLLKQTENKLYQSPLGKQAYLLALYISSIAQVQGIICLADNKQYRVSMNQVRTMFEICVNEAFIYSHPSDVFTYYLVIKSEQEKVTRLRLLHAKGKVKDADIRQFEKTLKLYEDTLAKEYPSWPDKIPEVFGKKGKNTPSALERINLKQRCQIADYYNAHTDGTPLTDVYDGLYPFFSDGAHGELLELSMAFDETQDNVHVDVDGSKDYDRMYGFARTVFAWHYSSIKRVKEHIIKPTSLVMPAWLRMTARDLGIDE